MAAREERKRADAEGRGMVNLHGHTCLTKQTWHKLAGLCVLKAEERGTEGERQRERHLSAFARDR